MDYKELIKALDNCGEFDGDLLDTAATAIETLLAERKILLKELEKISGCKWNLGIFTPPDREQKEKNNET